MILDYMSLILVRDSFKIPHEAKVQQVSEENLKVNWFHNRRSINSCSTDITIVAQIQDLHKDTVT